MLSRRQHGQYFLQAMPDPAKICGRVGRKRQWRLVLCVHDFHPQLLARSGNGEAFVIQQRLDANERLDIFAPIHPLAGAALDRLQLRKLRLPKTQNVGRQLAKSGNFANSEVQLLRNDNFVLRCEPGFRLRLIAHRNPETRGIG